MSLIPACVLDRCQNLYTGGCEAEQSETYFNWKATRGSFTRQVHSYKVRDKMFPSVQRLKAIELDFTRPLGGQRISRDSEGEAHPYRTDIHFVYKVTAPYIAFLALRILSLIPHETYSTWEERMHWTILMGRPSRRALRIPVRHLTFSR